MIKKTNIFYVSIIFSDLICVFTFLPSLMDFRFVGDDENYQFSEEDQEWYVCVYE